MPSRWKVPMKNGCRVSAATTRTRRASPPRIIIAARMSAANPLAQVCRWSARPAGQMQRRGDIRDAEGGFLTKLSTVTQPSRRTGPLLVPTTGTAA